MNFFNKKKGFKKCVSPIKKYTCLKNQEFRNLVFNNFFHFFIIKINF